MAGGQLFSQRLGYGVHALAYIGKKPAGELTTLPELAEWMRTIWPSVSETYLSNVVQRLARGRLLRRHRGIAGGYSLGRAAKEITLRDVVELLEGVGLDPKQCALSLESKCPVSRKCSIQTKLSALEIQFMESLSQLTIAELSQDVVVPRRMRKQG
jgi:Rrf2 family protein